MRRPKRPTRVSCVCGVGLRERDCDVLGQFGDIMLDLTETQVSVEEILLLNLVERFPPIPPQGLFVATRTPLGSVCRTGVRKSVDSVGADASVVSGSAQTTWPE